MKLFIFRMSRAAKIFIFGSMSFGLKKIKSLTACCPGIIWTACDQKCPPHPQSQEAQDVISANALTTSLDFAEVTDFIFKFR
jgi:hypothetical protein